MTEAETKAARAIVEASKRVSRARAELARAEADLSLAVKRFERVTPKPRETREADA